MQQRRLMSVHAHPDDESSKGAATLARYVDEGAAVRVVTCTGGERGSILNPKLADNPAILRDMVGYRRREMAAAAKALGVEHVWLGFEDSGLPEGDPLPELPEGSFATLPLETTVPPLVQQIREFRPHVLVAYNELGGYPHPDHLMAHTVAMAAFDAAADPVFHPELGEPWCVQKLYYDIGFSAGRIQHAHEAMVEAGLESPFEEWLDHRGEMPDRPLGARLDVARWFDRRDSALRAHATQIDPEGFFFAVPRDLEREVWPWEDFELAVSRVPLEEGVLEDDLFASVELDGIECAAHWNAPEVAAPDAEAHEADRAAEAGA